MAYILIKGSNRSIAAALNTKAKGVARDQIGKVFRWTGKERAF